MSIRASSWMQGELLKIGNCIMRVDPEIQSESDSHDDCNPKRAVGMRGFSTTLPKAGKRQ